MAEGHQDMSDDTNACDVGYRKPPVSTRFRKGQSGNPRGRPPGRRRDPVQELPYEPVLGQMVTVRENGLEQQMTAAEAFLLQLAKEGLDGDTGAARLAMPAIEQARARHLREGTASRLVVTVNRRLCDCGMALEALRIARTLDRYRPAARMRLEPWFVEAALERLGDRRLTLEEQEIVVKATRTPKKVKWPDW